MCGRYTLRSNPALVAEEFGLFSVPELPPHYNIAPTQQVAAVRQLADQDGRALVLLRWGLIPNWAEDLKVGNRSINARAETAATKPTFRKAFRTRRCLILADGFYEWQKHGKHKQPYYIRLKTDRPFAMAGLWEHWERDGKIIESCTILTTDANEAMTPIHDRMPLILPREHYAQWLDPADQDVARITELLQPRPAEEMTAYPISDFVNKVGHDSERCIEPQESLF